VLTLIAAQIEAIKLARTVREARPELIGEHCSDFCYSRRWRGHLPHTDRRDLVRWMGTVSILAI